jgi:voltage-gated potassium channel
MIEPLGGKARSLSGWEVVLDYAVILGALATIPLTVLQERGNTSTGLAAAEWVVWGIFVTEFLGFATAGPRNLPSKLPLIERLVIIALSFPPLPNFLSLTSLARLARLLPLLRLTGVTARGLAGLREVLARRSLAYVGGVTALLILAGGGCLSILEPQTVKGGFGDGVWWAIVTATTVGYGDISPTTLAGRVIAVLLMLVGIGLMSTLAASITSYFVQQTENSELKDLMVRLDRIERLLARIAEDSEPTRPK